MRRFLHFMLFSETFCYSLLFLFLSPHMEFQSLLTHRTETYADVLNGLQHLLQNNGLTVTAILLFVLLCATIVLRILVHKSGADCNAIPSIALAVKGFVCMLMLPYTLFWALNSHLYDVELLYLLISAQLTAGWAAQIVLLLRILRKNAAKKSS